VLLGVAVLDEPLSPVTVLGFGLIVAGSWLSTRPSTAGQAGGSTTHPQRHPDHRHGAGVAARS
jgi:drug/metabolite transporter (DMT)-like permease